MASKFEIKGVPRHTCHYVLAPDYPGIYQATCNGEWVVIQHNFHFCPFCGYPIENDPLPKEKHIA